MYFASPKPTQKVSALKVAEFCKKRFFDVRGTKRSKSNGFASILTKSQRKILISKSDSGLNALAKEM